MQILTIKSELILVDLQGQKYAIIKSKIKKDILRNTEQNIQYKYKSYNTIGNILETKKGNK